MRRPVLLTGPTASGKSELAMRLAERDGGVVVNADALQVYGCWQVLSARPSAEDAERVPHALYGHVAATRRYSVGDWLGELSAIFGALSARGKRPIITGGTGLYLTALTTGLADIPPIDPGIRARAQDLVDSGGLGEMIADLERSDSRTHARIDLANPMRVQRAWEVLMSTGRGLTDWQDETPPPILASDACDRFVIHPAVPMQHAAIEMRFRRMVDLGALDEAQRFMEAGLPMSLPSARALGASALIAHLRGEVSLDEAIEDAVTATRQFSKRQRQWFRGRMANWEWLDPGRSDPLDCIPEG